MRAGSTDSNSAEARAEQKRACELLTQSRELLKQGCSNRRKMATRVTWDGGPTLILHPGRIETGQPGYAVGNQPGVWQVRRLVADGKDPC